MMMMTTGTIISPAEVFWESVRSVCLIVYFRSLTPLNGSLRHKTDMTMIKVQVTFHCDKARIISENNG